LFHPVASYRVAPVQGLLPSCSRFLSSRNAGPLAVRRTTAHQPRSAATIVHLDFEASIHTKIRCHRLGLTAQQPVPLVRFLSPPGAPLSSPAAPVTWPRSAYDVAGRDLRSHDNLCLPPLASSQRESWLVCLQTADLLETFEPSAQPKLID
jgi:hypothetical protein